MPYQAHHDKISLSVHQQMMCCKDVSSSLLPYCICYLSACHRNVDDCDDVINEPGVAGVAVACDSVVLRCHYLAAQCLAAIGEDDEACEVCIILGMQ